MRVVEQKIIAAIKAGKRGKSVSCGKNDRVVVWSDGAVVSLHGHAIAKVSATEVSFSGCGWQTNTTKSRLNAILSTFAHSGISQKDFTWYLNGVPISASDTITLARKDI